MDAAQSLHPTDQTLRSYGLGKLDDRSAEAVNDHLMECSDCRKRVAEMSADSFLQRVRDARKPSDESASAQPQAGGTPSDKGTSTLTSSSGDSVPPELATHPDYEIKRELGRGGMGVVYLAHNTLLGRDEVLKVMGQHLMDRSGEFERFVREMQSVARLRHSNIVTAYHAARLGQSIVFAMEYVEGLDLSKLVKAKGPMPIAHACLFIHQAALGLQHAHEEGLVHRDIKPHNLMLSRKGDKATVKILDFGLAKAAREENVEGGLTATGQALGTPDYIAPEQIIDAQTADIRADIYSLGGTLYYLLTGHPPFQAKSLYDLYQAHISRDADPLNLVRPDVSSELAALVAMMMAKDPSRRFQTPGEVAQALKPFCTKANAALKTIKADVSSIEPPKASRSAAEAAFEATPVETNADQRMVRPTTAAESSGAEPRWESIVDFREPESAMEARLEVIPRRPPWVLAAVSVGVVLVLSVVVWFGMLRIKTEQGDLVISNLSKQHVVFVDGKSCTVEWPGGKGPAVVTLPAGKHRVQVDLDGVQVSGEEVSIETGKRQWITVRLEPFAAVLPTGETGPSDDSAKEPKAAVPPIPTVASPAPPTQVGGDKTISDSTGMKPVLAPAEGQEPPPDQIVNAESVKTLAEPPAPSSNPGTAGMEPTGPGPNVPGLPKATIPPKDAVAKRRRGTARIPSLPKAITNSIDMKLVLIPAGDFLMGSPDTDPAAAANEKPQHRVRITRPFYLGATEVTQGQYRAVTDTNPSHFKGSDDLPVERVSWDDAMAFCATLNKREEGQLGGARYRLPTEAEWEYACRAGTTTRFNSGDTPDNEALEECVWYRVNSDRKTHPVGKKRPNAWGLYDMHGNVWEWCGDWYNSNYYMNLSVINIDPSGPPEGTLRSRRGVFWTGVPWNCRAAFRVGASPRLRDPGGGFRVARDQSSR
jgi:formylglycine-generating enzyme required for sulfatase activity/serine/threonine protein kinase